MKASDVGQGKWPVIMAMGEAWGGSSQDTDVEAKVVKAKALVYTTLKVKTCFSMFSC